MFSIAFRYALISLVELAGQRQTLQTRQIADRYGLSSNYLAVVLRELRRLGLVESIQGHRGGYRLLRQPEEINLLSVYQALAGGEDCLSPQVAENGDSPADRWLARLTLRWSRDLEGLSLADLSPPDLESSRESAAPAEQPCADQPLGQGGGD